MNKKSMKPKRHQSGPQKTMQTKFYVWDYNQSVSMLNTNTLTNDFKIPSRSSWEIKYLMLFTLLSILLVASGGGQIDNVDSSTEFLHLLNDYTTKPSISRSTTAMGNIVSHIILK